MGPPLAGCGHLFSCWNGQVAGDGVGGWDSDVLLAPPADIRNESHRAPLVGASSQCGAGACNDRLGDDRARTRACSIAHGEASLPDGAPGTWLHAAFWNTGVHGSDELRGNDVGGATVSLVAFGAADPVAVPAIPAIASETPARQRRSGRDYCDARTGGRMTRVTSACAVVLALTGCGGSATPGSSPSDAGLHESNAHDAVSEAMPSDAGADDSGDAMTDHATSTVAIGGTVIAQNSGGKPVAGASVCAFEGKPCVQTAADGSFAVEVPAFANTGIAMSRSGYGTVLLPLRTASTSDNALVLALPLLADQNVKLRESGCDLSLQPTRVRIGAVERGGGDCRICQRHGNPVSELGSWARVLRHDRGARPGTHLHLAVEPCHLGKRRTRNVRPFDRSFRSPVRPRTQRMAGDRAGGRADSRPRWRGDKTDPRMFELRRSAAV